MFLNSVTLVYLGVGAGSECDQKTLCEILKELIKTLSGAGEMTQYLGVVFALSEN